MELEGAAAPAFFPARALAPPASLSRLLLSRLRLLLALHLFRSLSSSRSRALTPSSAAASRRLYNNNIGGKYGTGFSSASGGKGALWQAWKAKHGSRAKVSEEYGYFTLK